MIWIKLGFDLVNISYRIFFNFFLRIEILEHPYDFINWAVCLCLPDQILNLIKFYFWSGLYLVAFLLFFFFCHVVVW